jgi:DNA polymerase III subunit delta'
VGPALTTLAANLDEFLGNARIVEILRRAVELDRLPHALIFAGPPGVGKRTLALLLARLVNCASATGSIACGRCHSCSKIAHGSHPDIRVIEPDGAFIKIEQIRQMIGEIAYQPFEAKYRVVILDPAEQLKLEAANCMLKTLEEPPSRTIIILVTSNPYLLLTTIRSRSRLLQFAGIPEDRIADYLVRNSDCNPEDAHTAAALSRGSLGNALAFDAATYIPVRSQAFRFVSLLLVRGSFADASRLVAGTVKDKDAFPVWVEAVVTILQDVFYASTAPERIGQRDILEDLRTLAGNSPAGAVVSAIRAFDRFRRGLRHNVNRQIALEALFLSETARPGQ